MIQSVLENSRRLATDNNALGISTDEKSWEQSAINLYDLF